MKRIDILVSILPNGINDLEASIEEHNLKTAIGELVHKMGYSKFAIAGSDILKTETKSKAVLD